MIDPKALGLTVFGIKGEEAACLCPYHNDHTPSAYFNVRTGLFYCFVCGTGRNAKQVAKEMGGSVVEVASVLGAEIERVGSVLDWASLNNAPLAYGNEYLQKRGVTDAEIRYYDIRALQHGVAFPVREPFGAIVGMQIRRYSGEPRYLFVGDRTALWPMHRFLEMRDNRSNTTFVVEGIFGVLNAYRHGFEAYAVMGAAATEYAGYALRSIKRFKIWFDHDFAGYLGAAKLMLKADSHGRVLVPGAETDEVGKELWDDAALSEGTQNLIVLSEMSGNPEKFYKLIRKELR